MRTAYELARAREYETVTRPRIRIRYVHGAYGEMEFEAFDPSPPPPGTTLLTRFPYAGATLSATHRATINRVAANAIARMPGAPALHCIFIDVEGHEDETGDPARFGRLGRDRATAVAKALAARIKALASKKPQSELRDVVLNVSTAGPTRPIRSSTTADGRALNRRVEVRVRVEPCGMIA